MKLWLNKISNGTIIYFGGPNGNLLKGTVGDVKTTVEYRMPLRVIHLDGGGETTMFVNTWVYDDAKECLNELLKERQWAERKAYEDYISTKIYYESCRRATDNVRKQLNIFDNEG